ncbi:MAG: DUF1570 domain-containing protein [Thermoanaerobaculia bacterium]|nr:DUF1570 domain-containing protein [Thermoanaerobaculia bacterium]
MSPRSPIWIVVCFAFLATEASADSGELPGRWVEVRSEHFIVVSNARPKEVRKVATHLEQIRQVLTQAMPHFANTSGPPLLVFAPANERTMGRLLPLVWAERDATRPAGLFADSVDEPYVVLRADLVGGDDFGVVYHEYFHYLVAESGTAELPTWLSEGLADFWGGGSRLTRKEAQVGRAITFRLRPLAEGIPIPLETLLTVDRSSEYYRNRYKAADFYVQSWALTHLMMIGDGTGELKKILGQYLNLISRGESSLEAAEEAFGDLDALERKLRAYVRRLTFSYFRLPVPPNHPRRVS